MEGHLGPGREQVFTASARKGRMAAMPLDRDSIAGLCSTVRKVLVVQNEI